MSTKSSIHQAVLQNEVLQYLDPQPDHYYIDATFGRGGHSRRIIAAGGRVLGFDFDQEAIAAAQINFAAELATGQLQLFRENFVEMGKVVNNLQKTQAFAISGILFDFGTSTDQLMSVDRGFSFAGQNEILDMRMDQRLGVRAADLLKILDERQLANMLQEFGGEHDAYKIAHAIAKVRKTDPASLDYSQTLLTIIEKVKGARQKGKIHPATKTFQALRIVVNNELDNIQMALPTAVELLQQSLATDKKIVCIAFHEGEDRIVKNYFKDLDAQEKGKILTKKAIFASEDEIQSNHRARSARLRAVSIF